MNHLSRRRFLQMAAGGALAASLPFPVPAAGAGGRKPNIIFILADDLGYGDLGCFGQKHIQTPSLDRMCSEGSKFTSHYAGSTVCAPSRFTLLTGLHAGHARSIGQGQELKPDDQTLGTVMKQAGYRTACIGKWGLGKKTGQPNKQGFDHWFGFLNQSRAHFYYPDYVWRNKEKVELKDNPKTHKHYIHDLFTDESLAFIKENHKQPFFLYLPYTIPHAEVLVPEDSQAPYLFWDYSEGRRPSAISAIRKGKWKLVVNRRKGASIPQLYDLSNDLEEKKNLASANPGMVKELLPIMQSLWAGPGGGKKRR